MARDRTQMHNTAKEHSPKQGHSLTKSAPECDFPSAESTFISANHAPIPIPTLGKKKYTYVWQCCYCGTLPILYRNRAYPNCHPVICDSCAITKVQLIYCLTEPETKTDGEQRIAFKWDIILNVAGNPKRAVALLDTQCQKGSWISPSLLQRLGLTDEDISRLDADVTALDANGRGVTAAGFVTLEFKRPHGNKYYECDFFVLPSSSIHIDIILGVEFLVKHKIVMLNENALLPLIEHDLIAFSGEQQAIAVAREQQRKRKAEREAKQAAQQSLSQLGQTQQGQQSGSGTN